MWILQRDDANLQQTNEFYFILHRYPINFVSGYCVAAQIEQGVIGVQIAALKLKLPNLG